MKFNEDLSKGSGDLERTRIYYGRNDGRMDGLISIPPSASRRGIKN